MDSISYLCALLLQMDGNLKLADAMLRSARKANMPKRSVGVTRNEQK
jgi:hypothetical protein